MTVPVGVVSGQLRSADRWGAEPLCRWMEPLFLSRPSVVEKLPRGFDLGHYSLPFSLLNCPECLCGAQHSGRFSGNQKHEQTSVFGGQDWLEPP